MADGMLPTTQGGMPYYNPQPFPWWQMFGGQGGAGGGGGYGDIMTQIIQRILGEQLGRFFGGGTGFGQSQFTPGRNFFPVPPPTGPDGLPIGGTGGTPPGPTNPPGPIDKQGTLPEQWLRMFGGGAGGPEGGESLASGGPRPPFGQMPAQLNPMLLQLLGPRIAALLQGYQQPTSPLSPMMPFGQAGPWQQFPLPAPISGGMSPIGPPGISPVGPPGVFPGEGGLGIFTPREGGFPPQLMGGAGIGQAPWGRKSQYTMPGLA